VLAKDRKATAEFVDRYADAVFAYVRRRMAPRYDLVEDLVQEVFLQAWEALARFRGQSAVKTWLLGIARHKVQDYYRTRLRAFEDLDEGSAALPGFDRAQEVRTEREEIERALLTLPEPYRIALRWRYWDGLSAAEMAAQTGKTEKAVERLLARAREQFRRCYGG
jgi:RNA polymerase sigma-70 factor (ECF subfamily)